MGCQQSQHNIPPQKIIIQECRTSGASFTEVIDLKNLNHMSLKIQAEQDARIWLGNNSDTGTQLEFRSDTRSFAVIHDIPLPVTPQLWFNKFEHEVLEASGEDRLVRSREDCHVIGLEWCNKRGSSRVTIMGHNAEGTEMDGLESEYLFPHQIQRFCVASWERATWHVILANRNEGWVPAAWGLHPSTAVRLDASSKEVLANGDTTDYVCLARTVHNDFYTKAVVGGELSPGNHLTAVVNGSEVHGKQIYEVLCNLSSRWCSYQPDFPMDKPLELTYGYDFVCYGLVETENGEHRIGKVEESDNGLVCCYYDDSFHCTNDFQYLATL